jgi:hypothetical protein
MKSLSDAKLSTTSGTSVVGVREVRQDHVNSNVVDENPREQLLMISQSLFRKISSDSNQNPLLDHCDGDTNGDFLVATGTTSKACNNAYTLAQLYHSSRRSRNVLQTTMLDSSSSSEGRSQQQVTASIGTHGVRKSYSTNSLSSMDSEKSMLCESGEELFVEDFFERYSR